MGLASEASTQADRFLGPSSTSNLTPSATDPNYQDCLFGEAVATSTSTSAAIVDLCLTSAATTRTDYLKGFWVSMQSRGADTHIRFRSDNGTPGTTTSNGVLLKDGEVNHFWVAGARQRYVDHKASASGTLVWWRSSDPRRQ